MSKLHELLAAEKTPTGAWNQLYDDTLNKFKKSAHFFSGHSKSLSMIEDNPANKATEAQAREEVAVPATVLETLDYALDIFAKAEDLQFQKNSTNRVATGDVSFRGAVLFTALPIDELLGLEARLAKIRLLYAEIPTLDATKHWVPSPQQIAVWETKFPEVNTKTEKQVVPVVMQAATKEHPAQIHAVQKDVVVGSTTTVHRSGAATADQKANAIKLVDELLIEIKKARMRANETTVVVGSIAKTLTDLLVTPFKV
jgi:hypothetical protein